MDSTPMIEASHIDFIQGKPRNLYMTNRSLNLESAVQSATLVAAYHIDVTTRDLPHIDVSLRSFSLIVSRKSSKVHCKL
jgi:hypothetical protein